MADNQLLNEIGDEIRDALKVSLAKGDFSKINEAILNSVNMVIDEATDHLEKSTGYNNANPINVSTHRYSSYATGKATREKQKQLEKERQERMQKRREYVRQKQELNEQRRRQRMNARREEALLQRKMRSPNAIIENGKLLPTKFIAVGDTSSIIGISFGIIGLILFGILSLMFWVAQDGSATELFLTGMVSVFTLLSGGLLALGVSQRKLLDRAKRYAKICGSKMYAKLSQLAASSGLTEKKVRKDIKKMLAKGFYPEGYMDEEGTTLMLSDEVYKDYNAMLASQKAEEAEKIQAMQEGRLTSAEQSELDQMVAEGMDAVKKLHELNDNIPGEVITKKLSTLEDLLRQMFNRVKQHPEQMDRMHKLMDYYLPTMLKLVEAYDEYDKVTAPGKEIIQAKEEIEKTLDTINEAFVQLLNNLFQDSVWDVTSDAQVLTTMLTQEGLAQESALKNS